MQFTERDSGLIVPVEKAPEPRSPEQHQGHYGEPWRRGMSTTDPGEMHVHIEFEDGKRTGIECYFPGAGIFGPSGGDLAERIIACVNACRYISDEALSRVTSGEFQLVVDYREDAGDTLD